jgi:CheY-like chemotaxis protein
VAAYRTRRSSAEVPPRISGGRKLEIGALIVDDTEDIRRLVRIIIEAANRGLFVSGEAENGHEALAQLDECDPAVVVLDQMMPGMTGLETAALIRQRRPDQPMILYSAYLDDRLREEAKAVGIAIAVPKEEYASLPTAIRDARELGRNGR